MPTASTRAQLLRDICRELHGGLISHVPVLGRTTAAGTTTTVVDDALILPDADAALLDNAWLRIDATVGAGPPAGTTRVVRKGGFAGATGTITVAAMPAATEAGADYSLWRYVHPRAAIEALNRALRTLRRPVQAVVTLIPNGDFESGAISWTATGGGALSVSSAASDVRSGAQGLRIQGAGGGADSAAVDVVPGEQYVVSVAARNNTGAGEVRAQLLDADTGAVIESAASPHRAWTELYFLVAIPTATRRVRLRLDLSGSSDGFFDDAVLWPVFQREVDLSVQFPWLEDPGDVVALGYTALGRGSPGGGRNAYALRESPVVPLWRPDDVTDEGGANAFRARLRRGYHDRPLRLVALRPYAELDTDTATTTAPRELVVLTALWHLADAAAAAALAAGDNDAHARHLERRESYARAAAQSVRQTRLRTPALRLETGARGWL